MRSLSTESDMAAVVIDGILIVTLDKQGDRVNLLGRAAMRLAHARLDVLEARPDVRALLFVSGKERCFLGGGDLNEVARLGGEEALAFADEGTALHDRIARSRKPIYAAVRGACIGGGVELALACRAVAAADGPGTRFALPDVHIGIVPMCGLTQRLPRRVGVPEASRLILTGLPLDARAALARGLVDTLLSDEDFLASARRWVAARIDRDLATPPAIDDGPRPLRALDRCVIGAVQTTARLGGKTALGWMMRAMEVGLVEGAGHGAAVAARGFAATVSDPAIRARMEVHLRRTTGRADGGLVEAAVASERAGVSPPRAA